MLSYSALVLLFVCVALAEPRLAQAQEANVAAVEGYVYDIATGKPLRSSIVYLAEHLDNGASNEAITTTDANGFYSVQLVAPSVGDHWLRAVCTTAKGVTENSQGLYHTLRTDQIYHRNFYLTLPKRQTSCF
jgi:hypothetical protein